MGDSYKWFICNSCVNLPEGIDNRHDRLRGIVTSCRDGKKINDFFNDFHFQEADQIDLQFHKQNGTRINPDTWCGTQESKVVNNIQ